MGRKICVNVVLVQFEDEVNAKVLRTVKGSMRLSYDYGEQVSAKTIIRCIIQEYELPALGYEYSLLHDLTDQPCMETIKLEEDNIFYLLQRPAPVVEISKEPRRGC